MAVPAMMFKVVLLTLCFSLSCIQEIFTMTSPESSMKRHSQSNSPGSSRKVRRTLFEQSDIQCVDELLIHNQQVDELGLDPDYQSSDTVSDNGQQHLSECVEKLLDGDPPLSDIGLDRSSHHDDVAIGSSHVEELSKSVDKLLDEDKSFSDVMQYSSLHKDSVADSRRCGEQLSKSLEELLQEDEHVNHMSTSKNIDMDSSIQSHHSSISKYSCEQQLNAIGSTSQWDISDFEDAVNTVMSPQENDTPEKTFPEGSVDIESHLQLLSCAADNVMTELHAHRVEVISSLRPAAPTTDLCSTPMKDSDVGISHGLLFSPIGTYTSNPSCKLSSLANESDSASSGNEEDETAESSSSEEDEVLPTCDPEFCGPIVDVEESDRAASFTQAAVLNTVKIHSHSDLSVNEGILQIMDLHVKNRQSKSGLDRSIKTICNLLPENHNLPTSSYEILKYIQSLAPPIPAVAHFYCKRCLFYHGPTIVGLCEICEVQTDFGQFFCFDIAALLKFFFENRNLGSIMDAEQARTNVNPQVLKTLRDGSVYQDLNRNRSQYDVNVIYNSDGVRIRKGGKELWLAMVTIVEVPIHLQKSFLTIIGVWYDERKPNMMTFLKPFVETVETLDAGNDSGIEWTHPVTKEKHRSCVRLLVGVLDAPARAISQNVMHFNSVYGCGLCEIKAKRTACVPGQKRVRRYFYVHQLKLRSQARMLKQAGEVGPGRKHVKGVKGSSVFCTIPSVDVSKFFVPEYLHSCLLGVCKQLLLIWTTKPGPWSLKDRISEIDIFLKTFKHPSFVHRPLRQLQSLKYWKASDFYYFLFFEAVPALSEHLPDVYLQHFYLFIMALYKLLKTEVTRTGINEADTLLKLFVIDFGTLYGERELVSNVHQLLHLASCVLWYGPLHCFSAFIFEDLNGLISKATHGTRFVDKEIVNNIKMCQGIHILRNIVHGQNDVNISQDLSSQFQFLGKEVLVPLSPGELRLFDEKPKVFTRAKLGFDVFSSEIYKSLQSENFYIMWTCNGHEKLGSVRFFAQTSRDKFIIIRLFTEDHTKVLYHSETLSCIEHLVPVVSSERYIAVRCSDIIQSIVKVGKIGSFVYKRPNLYRYVM